METKTALYWSYVVLGQSGAGQYQLQLILVSTSWEYIENGTISLICTPTA
jgi:hypothetical protein